MLGKGSMDTLINKSQTNCLGCFKSSVSQSFILESIQNLYFIFEHLRYFPYQILISTKGFRTPRVNRFRMHSEQRA